MANTNLLLLFLCSNQEFQGHTNTVDSILCLDGKKGFYIYSSSSGDSHVNLWWVRSMVFLRYFHVTESYQHKIRFCGKGLELTGSWMGSSIYPYKNDLYNDKRNIYLKKSTIFTIYKYYNQSNIQSIII